MEKKKASLITMIMMIAFSIFSAIPFVYIEKYILADDDGGYEAYASNKWPHTMYLWNIKTLAVICVILAVLGAVCMFLQYTGKEHKFSKLCNYIPIATGVVYIVMSFYALTVTYPDGETTVVYPKGFNGYWRIDGGLGFYLQLALLICAMVLCYSIITNNPTLLTSKESKPYKVENPGIVTATAATNNEMTRETFNELIKYKELLDSEIITEEEFEEKKRQILGMKTYYDANNGREETKVIENGQI